jgi:SAM-dependent methyltransferase
MKGTPANEKLFWDSRARNYPLPFDPSTASKTGRIVRLLGRMGVDFKGRRLLDIGCGTGVYALPLASAAERVLGVDSSRAMLKVFRRQCRERGIGNAACRQAAWGETPRAAVKGKFDIALASMTMAVKNRKDVLKMEAAADSCVYIGWDGVRKNELLEAVYLAHGLEYKAPEGAPRLLKILRALGRRVKIKRIRDSWEKISTPQEALREIAINMKVNGARLKREDVIRMLARRTRNGKVRQRTAVRKALIVWQSPRRSAKKVL